MESMQSAVPEQPECQKLAEVGRVDEGNNLRGDDSLFKALVSGCHIQNAAVIAGVSERTVYRRLADPEFRNQIDRARQSLRESILAKLTDAGHDAIGVLMELMQSGEDESVRMKAAKAVLDSLMSFQKFESAKSNAAFKHHPVASRSMVIYVSDDGRNAFDSTGSRQPISLTTTE
jgi:hypothetical protein